MRYWLDYSSFSLDVKMKIYIHGHYYPTYSHPFDFALSENEQAIFDAVLRGHMDFSSDPWPSISTSAKDLVKKMLREDPKERLTAVDVLSKNRVLKNALLV